MDARTVALTAHRACALNGHREGRECRSVGEAKLVWIVSSSDADGRAVHCTEERVVPVLTHGAVAPEHHDIQTALDHGVEEKVQATLHDAGPTSTSTTGDGHVILTTLPPTHEVGRRSHSGGASIS